MKNSKGAKILTIVISCVIFICGCVLLFEFIRIANLKTTTRKLQDNLNIMQQEIYDYTQMNSYYSDRETYLEEYAREALNWGKADRTYYTAK